MMADRKVIVVSGVDFNAMKAYEVDALCAVLDQLDEYDYNTVIINAASDRLDVGVSLKRPSSLLKKLGERLTLVNFEKNTPARLASWLQKHFEHHGVVASPAVCALVIERCGRDMFNLAGETEKISFYVKSQNRSEALREDVLFVATPAAEYDAFAFTNAIGARRKEEALDILRELKMRRMDPVIVMSEITKTACDMLAVALLRSDGLTAGEMAGVLKIHDFRISLLLKNNPKEQICRNMVARCREADLELKMSRDGYAVIEKLICTI
jgi:DNA polymerase-3 subunit delta